MIRALAEVGDGFSVSERCGHEPVRRADGDKSFVLRPA